MEFARDDKTGDYQQDDSGKPIMTDSLQPACRTRLRGHRTRWLHKPDDDWGSDFYSYKKKRSVTFKDGLGESIAAKALEPLQRDGRIDNLEIETQFSQREGVAYKATFLDRQQQKEATVTTPIGVPV